MTEKIKIYVFISSKMKELKTERETIYQLIPSLNYGNIQIKGWAFEHDAPADHRSIREVYLDILKDCSLYIGVFWNQYGEWTIDEFDRATEWRIDRHIYEKRVDVDKRDQKLQDFLDSHSDVETGLTAKWFENLDELRQAVQDSINSWIKLRLDLDRKRKPITILSDLPSRLRGSLDNFIGRDKLLEKIFTNLNENKHVLLQGFTGTGKTSIAAQIAAKYVSNNKELIWLSLNKRSTNDVIAELAIILDDKRIVITKNLDDKIERLQEVLSESGVSLLVLDNAQSWETVRDIRNGTPNDIDLLVTSTQRFSPLEIIDIEVLDSATALKVLKQYAGLNGKSIKGGKQLCEMLGYLPFALRIAGFILKAEKTSPAALVKRYQDQPHSMKWTSAEDGRESVARLLDPLLDDLDKSNLLARQVFIAFGALFVPVATSDLLHLYFSQSPDNHDVSLENIETALGILVRHGLIDTNLALSVQSYEIHNLAYTYARDKQVDNQAHVHRMIQACLAYAHKHKDDLNALVVEQDNLIGAAEGAKNHQQSDILIQLMQLLSYESKYFEDRGYPPQTADLLEVATLEAQSKGIEQFDNTHYLLSSLGNYYSEVVGDLDKALEIYHRALAIACSIQNTHRQTVLMCVIAGRLLRKGDIENAKVYLDAAQQLATSQNDQIALIQVYEYLGYYEIFANNNLQAAYSLFNKMLEAARIEMDKKKEILALNTVASVEKDLGQFEEAIEKFKAVYDLAQEIGSNIWMGIAMHGLCEVAVKQAKTQKARKYASQAKKIYQRSGHKNYLKALDDVLKKLE